MLTAHFLLITTVFHLPWFETLEIPLTSFILHHIQYVKFFHSVICLASDFYSFSPPFHNLKQSISQELHFSAYNNNKKNLHQLNPVEFNVPPGRQHLEGSNLAVMVASQCQQRLDIFSFSSQTFLASRFCPAFHCVATK